ELAALAYTDESRGALFAAYSSDQLVHRDDRKHDRENESENDRSHRDDERGLQKRREPCDPAMRFALELAGCALEHLRKLTAGFAVRRKVNEHRRKHSLLLERTRQRYAFTNESSSTGGCG